jgi:hypothetical protein
LLISFIESQTQVADDASHGLRNAAARLFHRLWTRAANVPLLGGDEPSGDGALSQPPTSVQPSPHVLADVLLGVRRKRSSQEWTNPFAASRALSLQRWKKCES